MKEEIWKNTEYDGYMVSNKGRIKNRKTTKFYRFFLHTQKNSISLQSQSKKTPRWDPAASAASGDREGEPAS